MLHMAKPNAIIQLHKCVQNIRTELISRIAFCPSIFPMSYQLRSFIVHLVPGEDLSIICFRLTYHYHAVMDGMSIFILDGFLIISYIINEYKLLAPPGALGVVLLVAV